MGRPLTFNRDAALDTAMRVFWQKGYEAASLQDLLRATGLSKSSFYQSYGSKHELFTRSLLRYLRWMTDAMRAQLRQAPSGRRFIEDVFAEFTDAAADLADGCFVMNTATEFAGRDPAVATLVRDGLVQFEAVFHEALVRAQQEGDLPADRDARALARYLVSSRSGLKTLARAGVGPADLHDVVTLVYAALGW